MSSITFVFTDMFNFLYFLPVVTSLLWIITWTMTKKTHRQKVLVWCLALSSIYHVSYGLFTMPDTNYYQFAVIETLSLPLALVMLSILAAYVQLHQTGGRISPVQVMYILPGLLYGMVLWTLTYLIGFDNLAEWIYMNDNKMAFPPEFSTKVYECFGVIAIDVLMVLSLIEVIVVFWVCMKLTISEGYRFGDFCRFFLKGKKSTPSRLISLCIMTLLVLHLPVIINRIYVMQHPLFGILLAILISIMIHGLCLGEYHNRKHYFDEEYLIKTLTLSQTNDTEEEKNNDDEEEVIMVPSKRFISLNERFKEKMKVEKRFLDDDLIIADLAQELNVSRTTLSNMVNQFYGKNFRTIVNEYRIEHAKDFLLANPQEKIEQVAFVSGFKDSPAFVHKFKEIVGISPTQWRQKTGL